MGEKDLAGSTSFAESSGAREHGLLSDFDEEMDKLAEEKTALRSAFADIGAWNRFEGAEFFGREKAG